MQVGRGAGGAGGPPMTQQPMVTPPSVLHAHAWLAQPSSHSAVTAHVPMPSLLNNWPLTHAVASSWPLGRGQPTTAPPSPGQPVGMALHEPPAQPLAQGCPAVHTLEAPEPQAPGVGVQVRTVAPAQVEGALGAQQQPNAAPPSVGQVHCP